MDRVLEGNGQVAEVLDALRPLAEGVDHRLLEEFARRLLGRASEEWLASESPRRLAAAIRTLYDLLEDTEPGGIGVRVVPSERAVHRTVLMTVMPDCSFIVETLREALHGRDLPILALLHPMYVVERADDGRIDAIGERGAEGPRTSVILVVMEGRLDSAACGELEAEIRERLVLVRQVTEDFQPMVRAVARLSEELEEDRKRFPWRAAELQETKEFLEWLREGNFVFLGYRSYGLGESGSGEREIRVEPGTGLGILRDESRSMVYEPTPMRDLPAELQARLLGGPLMIVSKANSLSPVHRRARMDDLSVKRLSDEQEVEGHRRLLGLFTAKAFAQDAAQIPILRRKLREILEAEQVDRGSHDHGLIVRTFNGFPKEELFATPVADLVQMVDAVLETHATDEVLIFARPDTLGRGVNVMVMLPRDKFSGEVRRAVRDALLEAYDGQLLNYYMTMGESEQARLHFYVDPGVDDPDAVDLGPVRHAVESTIRSWPEQLAVGLERRHDRGRTAELADRYGQAFSSPYRAATGVDRVVSDIESLEAMRATGQRQVVLAELDPPEADTFQLRVFDRHTRYVLSDMMPVLENFGFRVLSADAYEVGLEDDEGQPEPSTIHTFLVQVHPEWKVDRAAAERRVGEAFLAIQEGWAENLAINSLVLSAGLRWREVALLKAYAAYAFRINAVASRLGVRRPLVDHPRAARLLLEIFETLFDPDLEGDRDAALARLEGSFYEALEEVRSIEDDRTLRRLLELVRATVRTNYFQTAFRERPDAPVALKFDASRVDFMPRPRPMFEVWVSNARTEGAHLRFGKVARGGLRWSDRLEDFRTEVLGLVKTQQVKNAVIVPAGAKGAFVVSQPPADPSESRPAGVRSYQDFVGALLTITDNVVAGEIVHPPRTVRRDGEDPYLVVAADKGTATLSDTANALAAEHGFWLGDAFASGGSRGYDHKAMGITARGAWECVKRHFREMGTDIQSEPFTVAGIGDMSGDVFGNGMLLSRTIRLVAAFDHRHVFLDPDPDPEEGWEERKRLFDTPGSTWADYDRDRISAGGGVWPRGEKRIPLSDEVLALLGLSEPAVNGDTLIRAILRAPVDLLWNGGIGTYVKASHESQVDVGDPSNDAVRVDASELRCKVIGEGGNLGLTQPARVQYALGGGRCNTDALDNSAGVDTSDHEVNLKILLGMAIEEGRLGMEQRDDLLRSVEEDVAAAVLRNSYAQSLAVTLDTHRIREQGEIFRDVLVDLERSGLLDRKIENLPSSEDMADRREAGVPMLTRPELSVLLAYAKLHLKGELLGSPLVDDPGLEALLESYFPEAVRAVVGADLAPKHRLAGHIAVTVLVNQAVDLMGGAGFLGLLRDTHRDADRVVKAWHVAWLAGRARRIVEAIHALDLQVSAGVQARWLLRLSASLERATRWLLANADLSRPIDELADFYAEPVGVLCDSLLDMVADAKRAELQNRIVLFTTDGLPEERALDLVALESLAELLPVVQLAREGGFDASRVGGIYYGLAGVIDFPWLHERLSAPRGDDRWDQRAAQALALDLEASRTRVVGRILERMGPDTPVCEALGEFRSSFGEGVELVRAVVDELRGDGPLGLAGLMVAVQEISTQVNAWSEGVDGS